MELDHRRCLAVDCPRRMECFRFAVDHVQSPDWKDYFFAPPYDPADKAHCDRFVPFSKTVGKNPTVDDLLDIFKMR